MRGGVVSSDTFNQGAPVMTSSVLNIAPEYNLSRYLREIHKFPFLLPEEKVALARR
jgi:hypothetical protein